MDTTNVPHGDARLRALFDAVIAGGDTTETDFLEAKSDIDLATKLGQAKVAKFVLAVANRLPHQAARNFRGHAVLVIGATKGSAPGLPTGTEAHELHDQVARYLGSAGPSFDLARLPLSKDREVLFVIVDPPEQGQPPFLCHSDFQPEGKDAKHGMRDGDIYVRVKSSTRRANAAETEALLTRAQSTTAAPVDIVVLAAGTLIPISKGDELRDALIDVEADHLRQNPPTLGAAYAPLLPRTSGGRRMSEEEIESRIKQWAETLTATWESRLDYLAGATLPGLALRVINDAASYLNKPRIDVTLHGCRGVEWRHPDSVDVSEVCPPVIKQAEPFWSVFPHAVPAIPATQLARYPVSWENTEDGLVITLTPEALRPHTPWKTDDDDIVVRPPAGVEAVHATWFATAEGRGERLSGEFTIPVDDGKAATDLYGSLLTDPGDSPDDD